jgi:hypothetical protein
MVPRHLSAISYYNPGVYWCTHSPELTQLENIVWRHILQRVFGAFLNALKHSSTVVLW